MPGLQDRVIIEASGTLIWGSGKLGDHIKRAESETGGTKGHDNERLVLEDLVSDLVTMQRSILGPLVPNGSSELEVTLEDVLVRKVELWTGDQVRGDSVKMGVHDWRSGWGAPWS